jgi:hypothetical protein
MGVWDLIRGAGGRGPKVRAVKGMPPMGVRQPGVGDGRTSKNRKVKVVNVVVKPQAAKHKPGRHK